MAGDFYSGAAWKRTRKQILHRDGHLCQIGGPGCKTTATQVDHIVPWLQGGAKYDPANLRASCSTCNAARANSGRAVGWLHAPTRIHLIVGPPGAGKTTHVQQHAGPDDLIVDWDALADATRAGPNRTGTPEQDPTSANTARGEATRRARNAILTGLRRGEIPVPHAWIISTNPDAATIFPHHDMTILDPGIDVAKERRPQLPDVVDHWYANQPAEQTTNSRDW